MLRSRRKSSVIKIVKEITKLRKKYGDEVFTEKVKPYIQYFKTATEDGKCSLDEVFNFTMKEYISSMQEQIESLKAARYTIKKLK